MANKNLLKKLELELREELAKLIAKDTNELIIAIIEDFVNEINKSKRIKIIVNGKKIKEFNTSITENRLIENIEDIITKYRDRLMKHASKKIEKILTEKGLRDEDYKIDILSSRYTFRDEPIFYYCKGSIIIEIFNKSTKPTKIDIDLFNHISYYTDTTTIFTTRIMKGDTKNVIRDIKKELFKLI